MAVDEIKCFDKIQIAQLSDPTHNCHWIVPCKIDILSEVRRPARKPHLTLQNLIPNIFSMIGKIVIPVESKVLRLRQDNYQY